MDAALDDIAFLANSENRVAVLERLAEAPRSRDELREEVEASRVTVARILRELETHNWIEHHGQAYAVTPLGDWVCREFARLIDQMEAQHRLCDALQYVPSDPITFDVQCLRDAEIVLLEGRDPTAVVRRFVELHHDCERTLGCARCVAPPLVEIHRELSVEGNTRVEQVFTPKAMDIVMNHSTARHQLFQMLDEPNAHYLVHEDVPISVGIVDDAVAISLTDRQGVQKGMLITDDETVLGWALDFFEGHRDQARPMEPETLRA